MNRYFLTTLVLTCFLAFSATAQNGTGLLYHTRQTLFSNGSGNHSHGSGFLLWNRRNTRLYEITHDDDSITVYEAGNDGSLSRLWKYIHGDEYILSGATKGTFSRDESYLFVTLFTENALSVLGVEPDGSLIPERIYRDGTDPDGIEHKLDGAFDLGFRSAGKVLDVTAIKSDCWSAYKVNGSQLYSPDIHCFTEEGVGSFVATSDGTRLIISAPEKNSLLDIHLHGNATVRESVLHQQIETPSGINLTLPVISALLLSGNERQLYCMAAHSVVVIQMLPGSRLSHVHTLSLGEQADYNETLFLPYGPVQVASNADRRFIYFISQLMGALFVIAIEDDGRLRLIQSNISGRFSPLAGGASLALNAYGKRLCVAAGGELTTFDIFPDDSRGESFLETCLKELHSLQEINSNRTQELGELLKSFEMLSLALNSTITDIANTNKTIEELQVEVSLTGEEQRDHLIALEMELQRQTFLLEYLASRTNRSEEALQRVDQLLEDAQGAQDASDDEASSGNNGITWLILGGLGTAATAAATGICTTIVIYYIGKHRARAMSLPTSFGQAGVHKNNPLYIAPDKLEISN